MENGRENWCGLANTSDFRDIQIPSQHDLYGMTIQLSPQMGLHSVIFYGYQLEK
jgi:hypothetical protein